MTGKESRKEEWFREFYGGAKFAVVTYSDKVQSAMQLEFLERTMLCVKHCKLSPDIKVFDQCCGIGAFARALAEKHGSAVVGIDLSEHFIEAAKAANHGSDLVRFIVADAREWSEDQTFDVCTCWRTSCAYSMEDSVNLKQFRCMSQSLKEGGLFIIDTINSSYLKTHFRKNWTEVRDDGTTITKQYFLSDGMLSSTWNIVDPRGAVSSFCGMTKLYACEQYEAMLESVGLKVIGAVGSYGFDELNDDSGRMILYGVKEL